MNLTFMNLVVLFSLGFVMCILVMLGMGLGAYIVYRTKRESHEPFFTPRQIAGDAGQASGYYQHEEGDEDIPMGGNVENILYGSPERRSSILERMREREAEDERA